MLARNFNYKKMIQIEKLKRRRKRYSLIDFPFKLNSLILLVFLMGCAVGFLLYPIFMEHSSTENAQHALI